MNPIQPKTEPGIQPGYTPYFYQSGQFQLDSLSRQAAPVSPPNPITPQPTYEFSTERPAWLPDPGPQTVEQIINSGYFAVPKVPQSEPEMAIISDKKHVSKLGLDDMLGQINSRFELYQQNIYDITLSMCEATNSIHRQEAAQGKSADSRQMYSEQKQMQKLYEQQRDERVNLWRDVSRLRLGLPETFQSYLSAYRKLSVLSPLSPLNDYTDNNSWGGLP